MRKPVIFILVLSLLSLFVTSIFEPVHGRQSENKNPKRKDIHILYLMSKNYGLNNFLMRDVFEQYGWQVTTIGVLDTISPCPWTIKNWNVPPVIPDKLVTDTIDLALYDALIISTGSGNAYPLPNPFEDVIKSPAAMQLINRAAKANLAVSAYCAGARVLAAANVINGKRMVGSPRFVDEYKSAGAIYVGNDRNDNPPTIDGNIITGARGQYYNLANCQAIATYIEKQQARSAKKIAPGAPFVLTSPMDFNDENIVWAKTYGGSNADGGKALFETSDGGFLITGYTFSAGTGDADLLIIKTDSDGNVLWQQTFGGAGTEYGYNGLTTSDGYLVIGYTTSLGAGSKDVYLIKMDLEGKKIWEKTYGGKSWDVGTALCATKDGNYMVCGFTHSMGNGEEDIYVLKIDRNGKKIWSKTYGGKRIEMGNSISAAADGGFLIGATSGSVSQNTDFYLLKINSTGGQVWEKNYVAKGPAGHGFDWCSMITRTRDGGAILTGYSDCDPVMDICTIKVDSAGNECWQNIMSDNPFYDYGNAVCETANNEFLVAGTTKFMLRNQKLHNNDFFYALMDANGAIKWEKTIPADGNDWCNAAAVTKDGGILLLGQTDSGGKGGFDVCLIKVRE